jgi:hypothetical protein
MYVGDAGLPPGLYVGLARDGSSKSIGDSGRRRCSEPDESSLKDADACEPAGT